MSKILFDKENENRPYIAANAVILKKIGEQLYVLLGKRKNVAGAGYWYLLGGHIHMGEPYKTALKREVFEEVGLDVIVGDPVWIEEKFEGRHHIIIYCMTKMRNPKQELVNKEPERCKEWKWFSIEKLPKRLWGESLKIFINRLKKKKKILI